MAGGRQLRSCGRPPLDDLNVPVDLEPVDDRIGDDRADALDRGELLTGRRTNRINRPEPLRQRAGSAKTTSAAAAAAASSRARNSRSPAK